MEYTENIALSTDTVTVMQTESIG